MRVLVFHFSIKVTSIFFALVQISSETPYEFIVDRLFWQKSRHSYSHIYYRHLSFFFHRDTLLKSVQSLIFKLVLLQVQFITQSDKRLCLFLLVATSRTPELPRYQNMTELTPNVEHGIQMYEIAKYTHIKHTTHIFDWAHIAPILYSSLSPIYSILHKNQIFFSFFLEM